MSPHRPDSTRWSLNSATKCGLDLYMRPCQRRDFVDQPGATYPQSRLCGTEMEAVFVAETDDLQREYLLGITRDLGYVAIGVENATELYEQIVRYKTGGILLDIMLRGVDGLALLEHLKTTGSNLPVVFISGICDVNTVVECIKQGASDFLQKPIGEVPLRRAIIAAIAESQRRNCISESHMLVAQLVTDLTPTELNVARMIAQGFPTKLIAAEMGRSENTVKIHRHRIFSKLMVNSAASVANIMHHVDNSHAEE